MTNNTQHPDWNNSWGQTDIRGYAIRAAKLQNPTSLKVHESAISRYEFLLREYMAEVKTNGLAGAIQAVADRYAPMGITTGIVYSAIRAWREENKVPVR